MSNIDKLALRERAESTIGILENIAGFEPSDIYGDTVELRFETEDGFDTGCDVSIVDQCQKAADVVRALLDDLESMGVQIANLTAERDTLREGEMGDAKHSNTRAAADIYFQLVEECEIPAGGSLVEYVSELRERAAMLQGADDAKSPSTIQPAPELDYSPKNAESPTGINQGKSEPVTKAYKLPMQPLVIDTRGRLRFKENLIVRKLLDYATERGYGLNEIAREEFDAEEQMQLAQLIGYSLSGYGTLSYVTDESYDRAAAAPQQEVKP